MKLSEQARREVKLKEDIAGLYILIVVDARSEVRLIIQRKMAAGKKLYLLYNKGKPNKLISNNKNGRRFGFGLFLTTEDTEKHGFL